MIAFSSFKRSVFGKSRHSERSGQKTKNTTQSNSFYDSHNAFDSAKENNMNSHHSKAHSSKDVKSPNLGSFLTQRSNKVTNDENMPPASSKDFGLGHGY